MNEWGLFVGYPSSTFASAADAGSWDAPANDDSLTYLGRPTVLDITFSAHVGANPIGRINLVSSYVEPMYYYCVPAIRSDRILSTDMNTREKEPSHPTPALETEYHPVAVGIPGGVEGDQGVAPSTRRGLPPVEVPPDQKAATGFPRISRTGDASSTPQSEPFSAIPSPVPVREVGARKRTDQKLRLEWR